MCMQRGLYLIVCAEKKVMRADDSFPVAMWALLRRRIVNSDINDLSLRFPGEALTQM